MSEKSPNHSQAAKITRAASTQTYYTILFLADHARVANAFRAYGYFRWLDDQLDQDGLTRKARLELVERQIRIMRTSYAGNFREPLQPEEHLLVDLIRSDTEDNSGLKTYIQHMMDVMEFDTQRRGRLITVDDLDHYSFQLACAVTEAMHYFIGHDHKSPRNELRYQAVIGAHITHMLRDTLDDIRSGYYNIPREYMEEHSITPRDINSGPYRTWVKERVRQARACFEDGREYLKKVESLRFRFAALAYIRRFEKVLTMIEQDNFVLRPAYEKIKPIRDGNPFNWRRLGLPEYSPTEIYNSQLGTGHQRAGESL